MYYSYIEIEYVATSFSPARTDLALKLLRCSKVRQLKVAIVTLRSDQQGDNTKSSMLYNLLRLDKARCFILDELLDKTAVQGWSAA
jgi:hypothetical protein